MRLIKKLKRVLTLCLALALVLCGVAVMPASAGKDGGYIVDSSKLSTESLTLAEWKFDETGVTLQEGVLVFDEFYDLENPVLSRTAAHSSEEIKIALTINYTITVDEIKGDKQFGLGFGISRLDRDITDEGSAFLYAQATEKGIGFGLSVVKDGEMKQLKELTHYGTKAKDVAITVLVSNTGVATVAIDDGIFYVGSVGEVTPNGYLGFSSYGGYTTEDNYVKARVKNFVAYNEFYAKPESPLLVVADFEGDEFNVNEWVLKSTVSGGGSGVICKDGLLRFEGAGQSSAVAAQFKYSDFEIQYEIFDMKNTLTTTVSGFPVAPSQWMQFSWGTDGDSASGVVASYNGRYRLIWETGLDQDPESPTYLQRHPNGGLAVHFYDGNSWKGATDIPAKYAFNNPSFDPETRVQIRLVNVNGTATLYMKLAEETEWTQIWKFSYDNGIGSQGYVVIRTEGNQFVSSGSQYGHGGWFSIDNIMIKNRDKNPSLITVTFESNRINPRPHYNYKDPYVDTYLPSYTGGKP